MAGETGNKTSGIKSELLSKGNRFSFVQCYRLLQLFIRQEITSDEEEMRHLIKVHPELSMSFPENDVVGIEYNEDDEKTYTVVTTFLGLYGASSPLPNFYTEDLLNDALDDITITRDFIDIINIPIYHLFFKCWSRHKLFYQIIEGADERPLERLYNLAGLGDKRIRERLEDPFSLLRYMGIITQLPRSAEGLRCLLSDCLNETNLSIEELVRSELDIPEDQQFVLGVQGHCLGEDINLGSKISVDIFQFNIHIGPVGYERFENLLHGKRYFEKVRELTRFYLEQPLKWNMVVHIKPEEIKPFCLGADGQYYLGCNTWLNSKNGYTENKIVFQS